MAATLSPSVQPSAPVVPQPTFALPTAQPLTAEQRWRNQQLNRAVFEGLRTYTTAGSELWWYDPINQQSVVLGFFGGEFAAQAQFTLREQGIEALEVPYRINGSYGLTALSPVLLDRIRAAGYGDWIETYVLLTPNVILR